MKNPETPQTVIALHDYDQALEKAVSWLGERYLLAEPAPRRSPEPMRYFGESRRWNRATRGPGPMRH